MSFSTIFPSPNPGDAATVSFPQPYNAAVDLLDRHVVEGEGDRVALVDDRGPVTWAALADRADRVASALRGLGVQPEQRVLMIMLDGVDFPAVFLGAMKMGAVPVPVNTQLTSADFAFMLRDSRARAVVVSAALVAKLEPALPQAPRVVVIVAGAPGGCGSTPRPRRAVCPRDHARVPRRDHRR